MANPPDRLIEEIFRAPTIDVVRRVELYESDGTTAWKPQIWGNILVSGQVSADQAREERRSIDLELDNNDNELDPVPGNFWYDKIVKVFYGIRTHIQESDPRIIIVEEYESVGEAVFLKSLLTQAGVKVVHYNPLVETLADVADFDILISISSTYTRKLSLLTSAFNAGKCIMTFGVNSTGAQLPYIISGAGSGLTTGDGTRLFERSDEVDPGSAGWDTWEVQGAEEYRKILVPASGAKVLANASDGANGFSPSVLLRSDMNGQSWLHVVQNHFNSSEFMEDEDEETFVEFLRAMIKRLDYFEIKEIWEAQLGEFILDSINDSSDDFSGLISVTGRDYTKRCLLSKLTKSTMFEKDDLITDCIRNLALNAGIVKLKLPTVPTLLGKDSTWERDTDRWSIMTDIALANNFELYFDAEGFLRMEPQQDPIATPASLKLEGGERGNLISRGRKTSDSNLFNHVVVVGESSDTSVPLVFAEAINTNDNSPSNVEKIGERTKIISSPLVTSELQAQELANTMLSVSSLEEFEMSFSAILMPWIEPGEILEMGDLAEEGTWGPAKYLISNLTFPLDLSPMSGSAKRVTIV